MHRPLFLLACLAMVAGCETAGVNNDTEEIRAGEMLEPRMTRPLELSAESFRDGARIPARYSDYDEGISPALRWSTPPAGTQSLVLLMEDPDAPQPRPFVHWILYNIPPDRQGLPMGVPAHLKLDDFGGALQGLNSRGSIGYFGPRPPEGRQPHRYYFQLFALARELDLPPAATRDQVIEAMQGHVLAKGEMMGTYQKE